MNQKIVDFLQENTTVTFFLGVALSVIAVNSTTSAVVNALAIAVIAILGTGLFAVLRGVIAEQVRSLVYLILLVALTGILGLIMNAFMISWYNQFSALIYVAPFVVFLVSGGEPLLSEHSLSFTLRAIVLNVLKFGICVLLLGVLREFIGTGILSLSGPVDSAQVFSVTLLPSAYVLSGAGSLYGGFLILGILSALLSPLFKGKEGA